MPADIAAQFDITLEEWIDLGVTHRKKLQEIATAMVAGCSPVNGWIHCSSAAEITCTTATSTNIVWQPRYDTPVTRHPNDGGRATLCIGPVGDLPPRPLPVTSRA